MKKIFIIYKTFYDLKGQKYTIGGIQTYIRHLIEVIQEKEFQPIVVQFAEKSFHKKYNSVDVYGVKVNSYLPQKQRTKSLLNFIKPRFNQKDILIFATETLFTPTFTERVVAIQHGITWDMPNKHKKPYIINHLKTTILDYRRINNINKLNYMVCVDNNYINWLRTKINPKEKKMVTIHNSTEIATEPIIKDKKKINIIFARRFQVYRGTRLFSNVIKNLLDIYENINITFAGEGPDKDYLQNIFKSHKNVKFIKYASEDSIDIHKSYHIAVVPTLGSEGTSLSLLEAMASKCAVIATNVGGMTDIILENYNGLMINPNESELKNALIKLIENKTFRTNLAEIGYLTVQKSFNRRLWNEKWKKVIDDLDEI